MRKVDASTALAAVLSLFLLAGAAVGQDNPSTVPATIDQIQEQVLRDALRYYSPNYDSLSRGEQLNAFTNIYKVLYNGQLPPLTSEETQLLGQTQAYLYAPPAPTVIYDPWPYPGYYSPYWGSGSPSGFSFSIGIGGGGWYDGRGYGRPGGRGWYGGGGRHGGGGRWR